MSVIKTYTGKMFDPIKANAEDILIEDIAHALSMLCRANGHFPHFYSVGQHSINCMNEARARGYSKRIQLGCLLHDGSEAYLSDITRPIKPYITGYLEIEAKLQGEIFDKWIAPPLTEEEKKHVFEIDDAILYYEFLALMNEQLYDSEPKLCSQPIFSFVDFKEIENSFMESFKELT